MGPGGCSRAAWLIVVEGTDARRGRRRWTYKRSVGPSARPRDVSHPLTTEVVDARLGLRRWTYKRSVGPSARPRDASTPLTTEPVESFPLDYVSPSFFGGFPLLLLFGVLRSDSRFARDAASSAASRDCF